MVKMLTVLVSTLSNAQLFLLKKMCVAFANAKATHIFQQKYKHTVYAIFNDQSFNDTLTNDIISFKQLGPVLVRILLAVIDNGSSLISGFSLC